ncbi:hypothetical protein E3N88_08748 [Mikania micrantha]|uniref:ARID domain-containing protein n=1 Tax=Mikania micrantha TaxID=192012 RepID=A0A5N6PHP5_9ASTR|nr:hypothetical protein E3N88_08748 [Mikania micrantha]
MVIQTKEDKLQSYLDGHNEGLFNEMMNLKGNEKEKGKEKVHECIKVDSLSSIFEFLNSLEDEMLPPKIDGYEIEMMHFYLIVKYMGGYEKVTKDDRWLDVVERMGLQVYVEKKVELCYMKYFGILDSHYKTMKNGVGTSKSMRARVDSVKGQFGNLRNYEKIDDLVWVT